MGKTSSKPKGFNAEFMQAIQVGDKDKVARYAEIWPFLPHKPVNDNLWTPLILASVSEQVEMVKTLVERFQVDLNEQDYNGLTALIHCSYQKSRGHNLIAQYLCKKGANLTIKTNSGITAEAMASLNNNFKLLEILEFEAKYGKWARHPFNTRKKLLWIYPQSKFIALPMPIIKEICLFM